MFISNKVTMLVEWENMDNGSQLFYQPNLLCGIEPNDAMRDNNNENVDGEDTNIQAQPSYLDFSNYFIVDKVYFMTGKIYLYVFFVLLLNNFFDSLDFSRAWWFVELDSTCGKGAQVCGFDSKV